jgi:hypothetical protein
MSTDQVDSSMFVAPADQTTTPVIPDQGVKAPVTPQVNTDELFKDSLASIVNENGEQKYTNVNTALAALKHSQEYVRTLEDENNTYRQEGVKAKTMDEVLQQMQTTKEEQTVPTSTTVLDVEKVRNMTFETIQQYEAQKKAASNQTAVIDALVGKFNTTEGAQQAFNAKASELGLTSQMLEEISATSPKAVLEYFEISRESSPKVIEGSVNADALRSTTQPVKARKNIMHGASTADILDAWRLAGTPSSPQS